MLNPADFDKINRRLRGNGATLPVPRQDIEGLWHNRGALMRWLRYCVNIIATLVLGDLLARWFANLPYDFDEVLPRSIMFVMRALGIDTINNADDIEIIGLLVIFLVSILVSALFVCGS